ncbi:hypothetical protein [Pseudomonas sp. KK4]|uniref:hypothetical protein n=1 Tax=Pseudomonas sp. KK4 TaxID=1855729 RepID=UPI00097C8E34|nr:hypothetical protein [Pseudomonas sp. KK4]
MSDKFTRFDIAEFLNMPSGMKHPLEACKGKYSGDGHCLPLALKDVKHTICERIQSDPEFAMALRIEIAALFHNGETEVADRMLRLLTLALRHQAARGIFNYRH